jgi:DNA-binding LytR/AlgR family response regulator
MRRYFSIIYWTVVVLLLSGVLRSATKDFISSLLLSVTLLPGVIITKFFWEDISFKNRAEGILHTIYLAVIALLVEYLAILFADQYLYTLGIVNDADIVFNPFFIWLLLIAFLSVEKLLEIKLNTKWSDHQEKFITFISERRKISLEINSIIYIESRDYEVWIRTTEAVSYRTRMNISHWEEVLDSRFVRIHRSFLVNRMYINKSDSCRVWIGDKPLEISRKYKEKVLGTLS